MGGLCASEAGRPASDTRPRSSLAARSWRVPSPAGASSPQRQRSRPQSVVVVKGHRTGSRRGTGQGLASYFPSLERSQGCDRTTAMAALLRQVWTGRGPSVGRAFRGRPFLTLPYPSLRPQCLAHYKTRSRQCLWNAGRADSKAFFLYSPKLNSLSSGVKKELGSYLCDQRSGHVTSQGLSFRICEMEMMI